MVKKKVSKPKKKSPTKTAEHILVQNSIELQKIMAKVIGSFDKLSEKINNLLELFEDSAKILVKKELESGKPNNFSGEILEKINKLMDQNKIIAKGLTMMHENKPETFQKREFVPSPIMNNKEMVIPRKSFAPQKTNQNIEKRETNPVFEMPE